MKQMIYFFPNLNLHLSKISLAKIDARDPKLFILYKTTLSLPNMFTMSEKSLGNRVVQCRNKVKSDEGRINANALQGNVQKSDRVLILGTDIFYCNQKQHRQNNGLTYKCETEDLEEHCFEVPLITPFVHLRL